MSFRGSTIFSMDAPLNLSSSITDEMFKVYKINVSNKYKPGEKSFLIKPFKMNKQDLLMTFLRRQKEI